MRITVVVGYRPVLGTVFRPCGVSIPAEPVNRLPCCFQFNTQSIALAHVLGDGLTDVVQFTSQHELVLVRHPIHIGSSRKVLAMELISDLQVVQALSLHLSPDIILVVVARRFLVSNGKGSVNLMIRRDVVIQSKLGVEEVKLVIDDIANAIV